MIRVDRPAGIAALEPFVEAGVLGATELEVASTLARVSTEADPAVLLALALAVRSTLLGHVCVDLATVAESVVVERADPTESAVLDWPDASAWPTIVGASPICRSAAEVEGPVPPLVLDGTLLYLDRYWRYEQALVAAVLDRSSAAEARVPGDGRPAAWSEWHRLALDRLFGPADPERPDRQRAAAEAAVVHRLTIIAGGPGTGKTRTVARLLGVLEEVALLAGRPLDIRLAAPTGKAAARMTQAIVSQLAQVDIDEGVGERLRGTEAVTLHRLLGSDGRGGFRHDADDPLPADVVVIDETSMVSLPLMARLFAAVRPDAQIVLVGDPSQLASVEAGAVLGDLIGSTSGDVVDGAPPPTRSTGFGLVVLDRVHRFDIGSPIAELADRVRRGHADGVIDLLARADNADLRWIDPADEAASDRLRDEIVDHARRVIGSARSGRADEALAELTNLAVLSATRFGPTGVAGFNRLVEHRLARDPAFDLTATWYPGRPIIVTANDYLNQVSNGDIGVTVVDQRAQVAFPAGDGVRRLDPSRLDRVDTWWAMTIHKSQGSEFGHVVVALPSPPSPILTRELLYTAVTRATSRVTLLASEASIRAAVERPVSRASGLADQLRRAATTRQPSSSPAAPVESPMPTSPAPDDGRPDDPQLSLF